MQKTSKINNWDKLPIILDLQTVALIFNVTEVTVKNWIYKGHLKGSKIGRKWIFDKEYIKTLTDAKRMNTLQESEKNRDINLKRFSEEVKTSFCSDCKE